VGRNKIERDLSTWGKQLVLRCDDCVPGKIFSNTVQGRKALKSHAQKYHHPHHSWWQLEDDAGKTIRPRMILEEQYSSDLWGGGIPEW
jgi:hypothetical protein